MTSSKTRKLLLWIVKIATLVISAPATTVVTIKTTKQVNLPNGILFFDLLESILLAIIVISTILLVEISFLYLWQLAEDRYQSSKDETEVLVYVAGVWLMYLILIILGFLATGALDNLPFVYDLIAIICFRFTVGLMLFYATYNSMFKIRQKIAEAVAGGSYKSKKVISRQKLANENIDTAKVAAIEKVTLQAIQDSEDTLYKIASSQLARELLAAKTNGHTKKNDLDTKKDDVVIQEDIVDARDVTSSLEYDHPNFTVVPVNDGWLMKCKHCDEKKLKDTRLAAIRTGASHGKKHNNKKKLLLKDKNVDTPTPESPAENASRFQSAEIDTQGNFGD